MKKEEITNLQKDNFEFIKVYLNEQIAFRGYANSVNFVEKQDEGTNILEGILDCTDFYAVIIYDTLSDSIASFDIEFMFENCEHRFLIYDIFNLFDIPDFKTYLHTECLDKTNIKNAIDSLLDLVEKYSYDLKKASEEDNLKALCKMHEDDKIADNDDRKLKDIVRDALRRAKLEEKLQSTKSDKARQKLIKELEKWDTKGMLGTYDRRYLEYLKAGYEVEDDIDVSEGQEKIYHKCTSAVYLPMLLVAFLITLLIYFITYLIAFDGGFVVAQRFNYITLIIAAPFLWMLLCKTVGEKIVLKISPDNLKDYVKVKIDKEYKGKSKKRKKLDKFFTCFGSAIAFFIFISLSISNVSFCDDYIKVYYFPGASDVVKYEDATIYLVENYYDDDEEKYLPYDNPYYAVGYDDIYYIGQIRSTKKLNELNEIFDAHNLKVEPIENNEVLDQIYYNYGE